ncbi:MAG: DUF1566 domain-containing protein [Gammaproteobacteria bacterium]|nr:DUF1566 domain-containing protein [Gammaproteobacteria bacterium]
MKIPVTFANLSTISLKTALIATISISVSAVVGAESSSSLDYPIVDTNQTHCYGTGRSSSSCPSQGGNDFGQDAQYLGFQPNYTDNRNKTVSDNVTRLMWAKTIDTNGDGKIDIKDKLGYNDARAYAKKSSLGGHTDWRLPSIKELYSLILFDGEDPSGSTNSRGKLATIPFLDNSVFDFNSGDTGAGERLIDSQYLSSTRYVSTTMNGDKTVFGVNFIDGRIKGYGLNNPRNRSQQKTFYVLLVRGNPSYGKNQFHIEHPDTVSDVATNLIWQKSDSQRGLNWTQALKYCENLDLAGNSNWRLPNAKELQSIVDYNRSPDTSQSASMDKLFKATKIKNEAGKTDFPGYWSSSTHVNLRNGQSAVYIAFGRSMGYMHGKWIDVHGAGSQRSDPKTGNPDQYPTGHGPQGDSVRINNYARCVASTETTLDLKPIAKIREPMVYTITGNQFSSMPQQGSQPKKLNGRRLPDFSQMDRNGDGVITRKEVRGPLLKDFNRLDIDGSGDLTPSEFPQH